MLSGVRRRVAIVVSCTAAAASMSVLVQVAHARPAARGISVHEFRLPAGILAGEVRPTGATPIVEGPDGNMWFVENDVGAPSARVVGIGRITPSGRFTSFPLPQAMGRAMIEGITRGPDGALWFTVARYNEAGEPADGVIGRITTSGVVTLFPLPHEEPTPPPPLEIDGASVAPAIDHAAQIPEGIVAGPDGDLWADGGANNLWRITPSGEITALHTLAPYSWPDGITLGPDGDLWVTEAAYRVDNNAYLPPERFARVTPTGGVVEWALPPASAPFSDRLLAGTIVAGPDKSLWFGGIGFAGRVTTSGQITKYPFRNRNLTGLTLGPDGDMWFADSGSGNLRLARTTPSGRISQYPTRVRGTYNDIGAARGPGRTIWLVKTYADAIIRVSIG